MKYLIALIAFVLLISSAYAFEFDNVKSYDEETKIVTFKDSLLGIPTTEIAKAKLETPQVYFVGAGEDVKVAEFWINLSDLEYRNWITEIKFYDLNNNWKEINKEITIKTKSYKTIQEMTYKMVCDETPNKDLKNLTTDKYCYDVEDKPIDKIVEFWTPIEEVKLVKGTTYIGLFTDVEVNEKVEWIPKIFNKEVTEWATWDSSLDNGLVAYWKLEETTGRIATDNRNGTYNITHTNTSADGFIVGVTGKIDKAVNYTSSKTYGTFSTAIPMTTNDWTWCMWANWNSLPLNNVKGAVGGTSGTRAALASSYDTANRISSWVGNGVGWSPVNDMKAPFAASTNTWYFVCLSRSTTNVTLWVNGTAQNTAQLAGGYNINGNWALGSGPAGTAEAMDGQLDEVGYWNRGLTPTEISTLYASGEGMTYPTTTPIPVGSIGITLNQPTNGYNTNVTSIMRFNYTITPSSVNLTNSTLTFSHTTIGATTSLFNNSNYLTNATTTFYNTWLGGLLEGTHTWNVQGCYINLTGGHACNSSSNYTFIVDTTAPRVVISKPDGVYLTLTVPLNYSVSDTYLASCYYNTSDNSSTTSLASCANTTVTFSTPGYKSITVYANDTAGNLNQSTKSFAIDTITTTFNNLTYETERESISVAYTNISGVPISASLNYAGTEYLVSANSLGGGSYVSNKTLDIGLTNTTINKSFYWTINYFGGGSATTATFNQTVRPIRLEACNATYTQLTRNYTAYDEETLERIYNYAFYGTFNYWLGSGDVYKTLSLANPYINETTLCISPTNENFIVNGIIQYGDNNLSYTTRNDYLVEATLSNASENKELYLLNNDDSTTFILKVQDFTQTAVVGAYIVIQRYYPGTNTYETVQVAQTDENGETLGFFKTETVYYRFIINNATGSNLKITERQLIFGKTTPYTLIFTVGELIGIPWEEFEDRSGLNTLLAYDNNTKTVGYTYIDTNSSFVSSRLYVEKTNPSGNPTVVCNETSTASSNLLTCDLTAYNESSFKAVGFNTRLIAGSNLEVATNVLIIQIDDIIDTFGREGLFWAFIIISTASLTMLYNPIAGLWVMTAATIFVRLIGLAKFGMVWIFGLIVLSIMLSILFKPKGGFYQ